MTSPPSWQTAFTKRRVPVIVAACTVPLLAACAATLLAACSGVAFHVELPAKPTAAAPSESSGPAPATPRQEVLAALTGYTSALGRAERSRNDSVARKLLRPYLAGPRIGGLVAALSSIWARGDSFYGQDVLHILSVRIHGQRAFVHDCDYTSGMGLANAATGQVVPGSAGVQHANLVTRLDLVTGHWVVESQLPEAVPCAP
jgi:hypothetical protein